MPPVLESDSPNHSPQTNLQQDAQLIVNLLVDFRAKQDHTEGYWKENGPAARLRLTCHILEALYLLDPDALRTTLDNGLAWLINLSEGLNNGQTAEDVRSVCEHPSRFKTLIWLNQFTDPEVQEEFLSLGTKLGKDSLLRSAQIDPILGSMIYLDGLLLLEQIKPLDLDQVHHRDGILSLLKIKVTHWYEKASAVEARLLTEGELSYAFDLLVRAQELDRNSDSGEQIQNHLCQYIIEHRGDRPLDSDVLYCAIHLVTHFPGNPEVGTAVLSLIGAIRQKYLARDFRRESSSFDPLYMRLLICVHGPRLKSEVMNLLLQREHSYLTQLQEIKAAHRQAAFDQVVKNRIRVNIRDDKPLTGGLTKAEVFRVNFQVYLQGIGGETSASSVQIASDFSSMVVKIDTLSRLLTAIERYTNLPSAVKPYFATHVGPPTSLDATTSGEAYLVLEDLTERYETFRTIVDKYDRRRLSTEHREKLYQACDIVLDHLFEIYEHSRQAASIYTGSQTHRLYLGWMERALVEAAQKHPHFKSWYQGFWLTEKMRFPGIEYYHGKLNKFKKNLRVKHLMLVHGDCHTRNIMIDNCFEHIKLIDLDKVSNSGDYIQDISMLIEDIAIFRFVFDQTYTNFIDPDKVIFPAHDKEGIENQIDFPPITSHTVVDIQQRIMERVEEYAQSIGDFEWRARLWLALVVHLLRLVEKQEEPKLASVLYVEAIKLLDTLDQSLENQEMPHGVPFPGTHGFTEADEHDRALWSGLDSEIREKLLALHKALIDYEGTLRFDINRTRTVLHYYLADISYPIIAIYAERSPVQIRLAVEPPIIETHAELVKPNKTSGPLRTAIDFDTIETPSIALEIIQQVIDHLSI